MYQTTSMVTRNTDKPLPAASMHLLLALLRGENHGYGLMRLVDEQSQGTVRMGPGTLYGTLNRLLAGDLIEETTAEHDDAVSDRRRYYRLTGEGERIARVELGRLRGLVNRFRGVAGLGGAPA